MDKLILFWHRRDLRIVDNIGLAAARDRTAKVVGVFCLDPNLLQSESAAPARVAYMIGCLQDLHNSYNQAGSQLLILHTDPIEGIPALAQALQAEAVFWNSDVEPYAQQRDQSVQAALQQQGILVQTFWDQLLHAPEQIRTGAGEAYTVYTPFWRNWINQNKPKPVAALTSAQGLTPQEQQLAQPAGVVSLPTAQALGFDWQQPLVLAPGTTAAQQQLAEFCQQTIQAYAVQRNFPAEPGTSRLSAALKFGAIGIRTVWAATEAAWNECRSDEARESIKTWQKELAWREFYQQVMYKFPELAIGAYRNPFKTFPWKNDPQQFQAWCEGKTGYPIVDAAMRQMNEIGWMHNRCRMIVASFLTKDLIINPQWGEKYFMQRLIDGDLSANNGGWQWSASSGMDPKPLRIFNPASQAQKFDPEAEYIRQWVPELSSIDTVYLVTGKIPPSERKACGYPAPIVDHNQQQREFKQLYQQQKQDAQLSLNL